MSKERFIWNKSQQPPFFKKNFKFRDLEIVSLPSKLSELSDIKKRVSKKCMTKNYVLELASEIRKIAESMNADYSEIHINYLLNHESKIPKRLRPYNILFPGSLKQAEDGDYYMPVLEYSSGEWWYAFYWLKVYREKFRFLRLRKTAHDKKKTS